jgi:tetratricopeptide (TPR) repeat protein
MTSILQPRQPGVPQARAAFAALAIAGGAALLWVGLHDRRRVPPQAVACAHCPSVSERRDRKIAFYQARVARDPYGARDLAALGALYLARARETGSYQDIRRAEESAETSLSHRTRRNDAASAILASSYLAEHRFTDAYRVAKDLVERDSTEPTSRAMLGEIALELGRYDEADRLFGTIASQRYSSALAPRYARWLELNGKSRDAYLLLTAVRDTITGAYGVTPEQVAWFDLRIGDLALRAGRLDEARRAYAAGLTAAPDDYRLLGATARLHAARRDWPKAIEAGEHAVAIVLDPATLGLLSDCYAALGDSAKATEYARAMEVSVSQQPGAFHRAWSLFLLDHDRDVPLVLKKAEEELTTRKDVYGYDLVAWALHKSGRDPAARPFAEQALSLGTRDAMLYYHAGTIARGVGDTSAAHAWLDTAKDINPYYQGLKP